ncbi:MAG: murein biosynthesis integral membrane protein MurJ [Candidatus Saccharibacteria bacterium]
MKNLLARINKSRTMGVAAFLISLSYFLSRLLGLFRDRLLATNFGVSAQTDAYTAAFRIPDFLFTLIVSGAFAVSFIPVFIGYLEKKKQDEAWEVANSILNILLVVVGVASVLAFIFAVPLVKLLAPGFDPYRTQLTVNITRIMLITPIFFVLSSVFGAIQQSFNRFLIYAMASLFYNIGIITGILFFSKFFESNPIYGVAIGVVVGTALQASLQVLGVIGLSYKYKPSFKWKNKGVTKIIKLMIPRSIDLTIDQINWIIQSAIASGLASGSLSSYYYANNLKNVPVGLFGAAMSTAFFPSLVRAANSKDKSKLPAAIVRDVSLLMFLVIPSAFIAIVMRGYIVRILFGFGDQATADTLGFLAGSIVAQSLLFMVARVFYSLEDTKTPLFVSIGTIIFNVALSIPLSKMFGVAGLGLALSISGLVEILVLFVLLRIKMGDYGVKSISKSALKIMLASLAMSAFMYTAVKYWFPLYKNNVGFSQLAPQFTLICIIGLAIYYLAAKVLNVHEVRTVNKIVKRSIGKVVHRG